jgi:hypothetical protein
MDRPETQLSRKLANEAVVNTEKESYAALLLKIDAFQNGTGPAPTTADFDAWKASMALRLNANEDLRADSGE